MEDDLRRIRGIADYQFGRGCGIALFPEDVEVTYSKNTGRIRHIYLNKVLLATLRPTDGLFSLTIAGGDRLLRNINDFGFVVTVEDDVSDFVSQGRSVFAKHVTDAGENIRIGEEVVVVDSQRRVLAVGKAMLNGKEMLAFDAGVAVKVRRGRGEVG